MSARTQMCFGDVLAEVGYNYLRTAGTPDGAYFLNMFRTLFLDNYRDFATAYPDVATVFSRGAVDSPEALSRLLFTVLIWKMGYLRGTTDAEGYYIDVEGPPGHTSGFYTGKILPGTNPRVRQVTEGARPPETPEQIGRNAARIQKRTANLAAFVQGFPVRNEAGFAEWFRNASALATWKPTFRDLTPATAEAELTASMAACEATNTTSLLPDALDYGVDTTPSSDLVVPGAPPVAPPTTPPATPVSEGSGFNVGLLVAGAAFGWLVTRFFR